METKHVQHLAAALMALLLIGCGGGGAAPTPVRNAPERTAMHATGNATSPAGRTPAQAAAQPPAAAVELVASSDDAGVSLSWSELNPGDYNNDGIISLADITPVAQNFGAVVADAANPAALALVDGSGDGVISLSDLTPIAQQFGRRLDGYNIYHAPGQAPAPTEFALLAQVTRESVFAATPADKRAEPLIYSYSHTPTAGWHSYYAVAYAAEVDGAPSNTAAVEYSPTAGNLPPIWNGDPLLPTATGTGAGIRLDFVAASDPEGEAVSYRLEYAAGTDPPGPTATVVALPVADEPPYSYYLEPLTRGTEYTMRLVASDPEGAESSGNPVLTARVPATEFAIPAGAAYLGDYTRAAAYPAVALAEPLEPGWTQPLSPGAVGLQNEPLLTPEGLAVVLDPGVDTLRQLALAAGAGASARPWTTPAGGWRGAWQNGVLAAPTATGLSVGDPGSGLDSLITTTPLAPGTAPLLLGDYAVCVLADGTAACYELTSGLTAWEYAPPPAPTPALDTYAASPAADGDSVYLLRRDGRLDRLAPYTGEVRASGSLGAEGGSQLTVDNARGQLIAQQAHPSGVGYQLAVVDSATLTVAQTWSPADAQTYLLGSFALAPDHDPPLLLAASGMLGSAAPVAGLWAARLSDGGTEWQAQWNVASDFDPPPAVSTGAARVFFNHKPTGELYIFDYVGRQRQVLDAPAVAGGPVLHDGGALLADTDALTNYAPAAEDLPPVWAGHTGVEALATGDGYIDVSWQHAVDDHGEPVHYVIYYRPLAVPELAPPYALTTLITDIPHTGTSHSYRIEGLANGTRYYVVVRAYDGYWDDGPNLELNTHALGATPPWQREELVLGADLPAGEAYYMRGLAAPDGSLHLIYNDEADTHLSYVHGTTGSWQHEGDNLAAYSAISFSPVWDTTTAMPLVGWATADDAGILTRTGVDQWNAVVFGDINLDPAINPQVAFAHGAEMFLAYNQHIEGGLVENETDYYLKRTVSSGWQPAEPLDEANLSGRDIDAAYDPADDTAPWAVFQRGGESVPNRHTPEEGELVFARWDGTGGSFNHEVVDAGDNAPASDCGKRVRLVLAGDGNPHLAYLDLDASATGPLGQLKYAVDDGGDWDITVLADFDLGFQEASLQYTWGELGLALNPLSHAPGVAHFRRTLVDDPHGPHLGRAVVYIKGSSGWRTEQLTDGQWLFPIDREPCVLLADNAGVWHLFYFTCRDQDVPDAADTLVHLWRPVTD